MELDHDFAVPVPVDQAWPVLLDVERVAACMPGAILDSADGDEYKGRLKVKVGAMTITYRGTARIVSADDSSRTVTLEASGKEARGSGTASATVQAKLHEEDGTTRVTVHTKLNVTGRPAQFGRNILSEVGSKLIARFAKALAEELESSAPAPEPTDTPEATADTSEPTDTAKPPGESKPTSKDEAANKSKAANKSETANKSKAANKSETAEKGKAASKGKPAGEGEGEAAEKGEGADKPGPVTADVVAPVADASAERSASAKRAERPPLRVAREDDAIDLLEVAGPSVAKRAAPAVGGLVGLALAVRFFLRRRRKKR